MILENKDCLEFLKELDTESVELVLTDPPYFIGFDGGKGWDSAWDTEKDYLDWCMEWSEECARVLKPNGCMYVWGTTKTDTFTTTSTSFTDVTGLSASITPISTSNKVLVNASIQVGGSATSRGALKLLRGSTDIYIGDAASSRTRATIFTHPRGGAHVMSSGIIFLDSPSSTSSTTYKIQAEVESGQTLAINRSGDDTDNSGYYRTPSSITLMEVSA